MLHPYRIHSHSEKWGLLRTTPDMLHHKSQPLFQKYESILPTSLTHIVLIGQRLLTLETCCGLRYGHLYKVNVQITGFPSVPWRSAQTKIGLPCHSWCILISTLSNSQDTTTRRRWRKPLPVESKVLERKASSSAATMTLRQLLVALQLKCLGKPKRFRTDGTGILACFPFVVSCRSTISEVTLPLRTD